MILYHFTSHEMLPAILEEGLSRGEVPLNDRDTLNAVNLTTDPAPHGHGLDRAGHVVTADESAKMFLVTGTLIPPGTVYANKKAVRITVKVPSSDRALKDYLPWARKHIEHKYLKRLIAAAGGGTAKAKTWKLYFGVIPPSAFVSVDILERAEEA